MDHGVEWCGGIRVGFLGIEFVYTGGVLSLQSEWDFEHAGLR